MSEKAESGTDGDGAERLGKSKTVTHVTVFYVFSLSLWERAGVRASVRTLCFLPGGAALTRPTLLKPAHMSRFFYP